ncbi:hypothetical protein ACJRO7_021242 [Eucalyptus globulus]|uniref:Splicing factor Cactin n=1 Tax=Eucalyptus globulus TaxID=34317 RepID=A0ABD3KNN9_EUCGL
MFSIKAETKGQKERGAEIEKVKKRREEGVLEKAQHEEEMAMLARGCARAEFQDWEKERRCEGCAKAIDILLKHLNGSDDLDIELNEPYMVFKGLTVKETEELRGDVKMHLDLDTDTLTHVEKKDALDRVRACGEEPPAELLAEETGAHSRIEADDIHAAVEAQLSSATAIVVEFWKVILKCSHIQKHLQRLEQPEVDIDRPETTNVLSPIQEEGVPDDEGSMSPEPLPKEEMMESEEEAGSFSLQLLHGDETEGAIDPEENRAALEWKRMEVLEERQRWMQEAMASKPAPSEDNFEMKAIKAMGATEEGDAVFGTGEEDIAFRIVYKAWEYSHKKGFKCTFEGGSLHVYFNFKRHRHR